MDTKAGSTTLEFRHALQHSPEHLAALSAELQQGRFGTKSALRTATLLACHGLPPARSFLNRIQNEIDHPDVEDRVANLLGICDYTDGLEALPQILADQSLFRKLYSLHGFTLIEGSTARNKLVVVFTTMFNNFGVANTVLLAVLKKYGVSVLLLKDPTRANYLGGASGFGKNIDDMSIKIDALARERSFDSIYLTGYSSGGYASSYASMRIDCAGLLNFSSPADFSLDTTLPTDRISSQEVRQLFDPRHLLDLRSALSATPARRRMIVGTESTSDLLHANHLRGVAGLDIIEIEGCEHGTPETLISRGEFERQLDWLLQVGN